ncbi:Uncharacterized membrane protein, DUF441 family [Evansella caseinilytica]|uniref:UPF0756 membrane protein SAMN05421736_116102 n=1 Tax=Evansella caseinilytica TaxID=1503961 RepID=A0A1H3TXH2_9BACI|nr:DUF441 domain-containing protein [Evansella caseinilytica]SDZ54461.1 Uncharacterized membrane protein, DUF441 family [Evansella caseinilytica]
MTQATIFMLILLGIGLVAKNHSLVIAVSFLLLIKWIGVGDKVFPFMQQKGIQLGVTIITVAVLVPIVTGEIGLKDFQQALHSSYAWIALASGIFVAVIAANGVELLQNDPHITAALVFGTIIAVAVFHGVAVGPLIGAGIAYMAMRIVQFFSSMFH